MKMLIIVRLQTALTGLALLLSSAFPGSAVVLRVPADYPTIQGAVDAAVSGDEIQIAAGVYSGQVVITNKSLMLSGSPGAVLRAIPGMSPFSLSGTHVPLLGIGLADVVVSGLTLEGERLVDSQSGPFDGIQMIAAGGRIEDCRIMGFRGSTLSSTNGGRGIFASNPHGFGVSEVNVQVLGNTFADTQFAIVVAGDLPGGGQPTFDPTVLRTTFAVNDNIVAGNGPDATGRQFGIQIFAGARGELKRNTITDYAYVGTTDPDPYVEGVLAVDGGNFGHAPLAALQPIHFEGNIFRHNQIDLAVFRGDDSTIVNNSFEEKGEGLRPYGLAFSGDNVLVGTNRFSDLETGIFVFGNDPHYGEYLGVASNATLVANSFCNVGTNITVEPPATYTEQGTLGCPRSEPTLESKRAVLLSWPEYYEGYSAEAAPTADGPWNTADATLFVQGGRNCAALPADRDHQFFRLVKH